ncbi:MAG: hypothetical protein JWL59_4875 [Chthoniobacteraceae bacterium]|nr:hypothetical protein [Chthoniobacteraceae bacterium]
MNNRKSPQNSDSDEDDIKDPLLIFALFQLASKFPDRRFTGAQLSILMGIGRTAISQIKNEPDSPFSLSKCTMKKLGRWLDQHSGYKQH